MSDLRRERRAGRRVGEPRVDHLEQRRELDVVGQRQPHHRDLGGEPVGHDEPRRDDGEAAPLRGEPREDVAQAADGERIDERVVEVERGDEQRRRRAQHRLEQRGHVARRRGEPVEAARSGPDGGAGAERAGGGLADGDGPLLLGRHDVDERRPRRPELRDLLGGRHGAPSASAVARIASSKDVAPDAILRIACSRSERSPSWRAVRASASGVAPSAMR